MTLGWIYQSQGRTDLMFGGGPFAGTASLIAFGIGVQWGALGVAIAYAIRVVALTPIALAIPGRLIGVRSIEVAR